MDLHVENPLFETGIIKEMAPSKPEPEDDQELYECIPYEAVSQLHRLVLVLYW